MQEFEPTIGKRYMFAHDSDHWKVFSDSATPELLGSVKSLRLRNAHASAARVVSGCWLGRGIAESYDAVRFWFGDEAQSQTLESGPARYMMAGSDGTMIRATRRADEPVYRIESTPQGMMASPPQLVFVIRRDVMGLDATHIFFDDDGELRERMSADTAREIEAGYIEAWGARLQRDEAWQHRLSSKAGEELAKLLGAE